MSFESEQFCLLIFLGFGRLLLWQSNFLNKSLVERKEIASSMRDASQEATSEKSNAITDVSSLAVQDFVNENVGNLNIPTIVLHGKEDTIVPISGCKNISKLENVTFVEVENSKHEILNQDTRPFVLSEIHQWLKENKII